MELSEAFEWRYATKKFDPTKKVDESFVKKIVDAAWLAPTSSGLQPFELFVITNQELKEKFVSASFGQNMPAECSHLLVFAAWDNYTIERIRSVFDYTAKERNQPADRYDAYIERLKAIFFNRPAQANFEHAARQAYIAMGFAMAQAATLKVDSVPMEGFSPDEVDGILQLKDKGLKSVLLLPLGYRDESGDWLLPQKKVRRPINEFLTEIA